MMVLTGVSMALCLFLSPTALLDGILVSDGSDSLFMALFLFHSLQF